MQHLHSQDALDEKSVIDLVQGLFAGIHAAFIASMVQLVFRAPSMGSDGSTQGRFIVNERISTLLNSVAQDNEGRPLVLWARRKGKLEELEARRVSRLNRGKEEGNRTPPRPYWGNQKIILGFRALDPEHWVRKGGLEYRYMAFHLGVPKPGKDYAYKFLAPEHLDSLGLMWFPHHNPRKSASRAKRVCVDEQGHMMRTKRRRPAFEDSPLILPVTMSADEVVELEILMLITELAEQAGVIASRACTLRPDGSLEQGLLPHGRVDAAEISDLYQYAHAGDDVSAIKAMATLEQYRTRREDDSDEYVDGSDRADDAEFGKELFAKHTGYSDLVPIHRHTEEENKEGARPTYRIDKLIELYRFGKEGLEPVTYEDEQGESHVVNLRTKEFHAWDATLIRSRERSHKGVVCYGPGKEIEPVVEPCDSIADECEGILMRAVEERRFRARLLQRTYTDDAGNVTPAARQQRPRTKKDGNILIGRPKHYCQRCGKRRDFTRMNYADVCPICGNEYFHVRMQCLIKAKFLRDVFQLNGVDVVGFYVYGKLVGQYLEQFPIVDEARGWSSPFQGKDLTPKAEPTVTQRPRKRKMLPVLRPMAPKLGKIQQLELRRSLTEQLKRRGYKVSREKVEIEPGMYRLGRQLVTKA